MAYMNQERKNKLAPAIKAHCAKYGMKCSIGVSNHMTLVVNLKSGKLDLCQDYLEICGPQVAARNPSLDDMKLPTYIQVNEFWCRDHFSGDCKEFIVELVRLMNIGNHDRSDISTDYFDIGWYINLNIGAWDKPYEVTK